MKMEPLRCRNFDLRRTARETSRQRSDKREQTPTLTFPKTLDPAQFLVVWGLPTAK